MTPTPTHPTWGWTVPVRVLLATLAGGLSLGLFVRTGETIPESGLRRPPILEVDPNTAPIGVLIALPALGPTLSARIVEGRRDGPFRSLDDLDRRVKGIGPATVDTLRPHLRFQPHSQSPPPR